MDPSKGLTCAWSESMEKISKVFRNYLLSLGLTVLMSSSLTLISGSTGGVSCIGNGGNVAGEMTLSPGLMGLFLKLHLSTYCGPPCWSWWLRVSQNPA